MTKVGPTETRPDEQTAERAERTVSAMSVRVAESSVGRKCAASESTRIRLTCSGECESVEETRKQRHRPSNAAGDGAASAGRQRATRTFGCSASQLSSERNRATSNHAESMRRYRMPSRTPWTSAAVSARASQGSCQARDSFGPRSVRRTAIVLAVEDGRFLDEGREERAVGICDQRGREGGSGVAEEKGGRRARVQRTDDEDLSTVLPEPFSECKPQQRPRLADPGRPQDLEHRALCETGLDTGGLVRASRRRCKALRRVQCVQSPARA